MQLTQGTLLHGGAYRIEQVLGQGSFGITYLATHTMLCKKVAIKEFFMKELNGRGEDGSITGMSDGSLSMNYARKFQKEALNLSRLEHPNIVRVTDSFEDNGTFYYVMDFIEGENLNDYIKHTHVSQQEALNIIRDIATALMYMHEEKHMLHLDLKPGNVMRRASDGHIFLIDFGLSKHYSNNGEPETSTTIGLGTTGYAPIEQANQAKNGEFRPTIDIYALGATFYKLLTGETPPAASELVSDDELLIENLQKHGINHQLSNIVVKAMLPNVRKRTQTVREFIDRLTNGTSDNLINKNEKSYTQNANEDTLGTDINKTMSEAFAEHKAKDTIVENSINSKTGHNIPADKKKDKSLEEKDSKKSESTSSSEYSANDEETRFEVKQTVSHPNFSEDKYIILSIYRNIPVATKLKADKGNLDAMIALGMIYLRGDGQRKNFTEAYSWFKKAKDYGDDRGAWLIDHWDFLKEKYNTQESDTNQTSDTTEAEKETVEVESIYSFNGRIGRLEYLLSNIVYIVSCIAVSLVAAKAFANYDYFWTYDLMQEYCFVIIISFMFLGWPMIAQGAKRCHDIGKSGWCQLIPYFIFVLIFVEGDKNNKYGTMHKRSELKNTRILAIAFIASIILILCSIGSLNSGVIDENTTYILSNTDTTNQLI